MKYELTPRQVEVARFALYMFARNARLRADAAAQKSSEEPFSNVAAFLKDATDAEELIGHLAAAPTTAATPAGMMLVPVEPTPEMLRDAQEACGMLGPILAGRVWSAMLAAAPKVAAEDLAVQAPAEGDEVPAAFGELVRLANCCPELNLSNYGPDDVDELNGWAIEVAQEIDRLAAAQLGTVPMPNNADQAAAMALIGERWLRDNAPERLRANVQPKGTGDAEVARLRELAATCYAGLGAECDLPEQWLDVLNAAANGEPFATDGLLPFTATQAPAPAHALLHKLRAHIVWLAFGECRSPGWEGPPPTAREAVDAIDAALAAQSPAVADGAAERVATVAAKLRAMATNYPAGHLWDKLDAKACIEGALLLEGTHPKLAARAVAQPTQLTDEQARALRPVPFSNAELDRLYANIPPTAQQDARSREAFKRIARIVEAGHDIVSQPPVQSKEQP